VPVRVEEATAVSGELSAAMERLPATRLLVARNIDDDVVGSLTLALVRLPTGLRGGLYDLEVDRAERQHGVAEMLIMEAVRLAHEAGARSVDLMSDPAGQESDDWYRRLGFKENLVVHRRELS
jgi:ribosomal protein S18 acetylase RimI-like enzyme